MPWADPTARKRHDQKTGYVVVKRYHRTEKGRKAKHRAYLTQKGNGANRDGNLKRLYGLSTAAWNMMFFEQGMKCKTCGTYDPGTTLGWHTHHTGLKVDGSLRVHGVLCSNCNHVLTKHMTPWLLRRLAQFMETYCEN